jgi:hypothetical protein
MENKYYHCCPDKLPLPQGEGWGEGINNGSYLIIYSLILIASGMAQASLSTRAMPVKMVSPSPASRDDGQDVQVPWSTGMCKNGHTYIPAGKTNPALRRGL